MQLKTGFAAFALLLNLIATAGHSAVACTGGFAALQIPDTSGKAATLMREQALRMKERAATLSRADLENEADQAIRVITARDGYLPGCTPDWTPADLGELLRDFKAKPRGSSMLRQVSGNLRNAETIADLLAMNGDEPLEASTQAMIKNYLNEGAWHSAVFNELEKRLLERR